MERPLTGRRPPRSCGGRPVPGSGTLSRNSPDSPRGGAQRAADIALAERCRARDERAWADLYEAHAERVGLFLRAVLGDDDVEDVLQRTFLEAIRAIRKYNGDAKLSTWLHGIAANVARKEVRSRVRRRRKHDALFVERWSHPPGGGRPDLAAEARQRLATLRTGLGELDVRLRTVWVLRELEGMSVDEVAQALRERPATIRTRHHRARKRLIALVEAAERPRAKSERPRERRGALIERQEIGS